MSPKRRGLLIIVLVIAALGVTAFAIRARPWLQWRFGRAEPPAIALDTLAPPVAKRVRERTDEVRDAPYDAAAWGRLGDACYVHELLPEARLCYARAEKLDPENFRWPYFIGLCESLGESTEALANFERAYALNPDYPPLLVHLGRIHVAREEFARAKPLFERALAIDPGVARGRLDLATVALGENAPEEALAHLEAARDLLADRSSAEGAADTELCWLFSETYRRLGDLDQASAWAERASGTTRSLVPVDDPLRDDAGWREGANIDWCRARSDEYRRSGDIERAIEEWRQAVRDDPASALAQAFLGEVLATAGRNDEAIPALESALRLDPALAWPKSILGRLLVRQGQVERGIELLRAAVEEDPENAGTAFNLARTLARAGRGEEAEIAWDEALRNHPAHEQGVLDRTELLLAERRSDEAISLLHVAIERAPASVAIRLRLAWALDDQDRTEEAIALLREGLAIAPDDGHLAHDLAWLLSTTSRDDLRSGAEAVALLEPLSRARGDRDPFLLDTLAAACAETGDFEAARRHAARAIGIVSAMRERDATLEALLAALQAHYQSFEMGQPIR